MDIADKVNKTILNNGLIQRGEHIVIGLSGGPDSVCLFHILYRLAEELDIRLHAVHINHGLRPGAADEDQRYAEALCAEYQVPCHSFSFDVNRIAKEQGISSEDAGRQVRYRSFFEVADRIAAETGASVKVAVAQNMNDQAETVLMRIIRGTGTDGLTGIEYLRTEKGKGVVIRPLLDVTREEIEAYCRENNLNPRTDLTNLEPVYTRNKIRLELIPYLAENFNPNINAALSRLSRIAKEDKDYFSGKVDAIIAEHAVLMEEGQDGTPCRAAIPLAVICGAHPAIRHRLIIKLFESIGLSKDIAASHLEQADRLLQEGKTSTATDFTAGYAMKVSYDIAEFYKKTGLQSIYFEYEIDLNQEGVVQIPELNEEIRVKILRRQECPEFWRQEFGDKESGKKKPVKMKSRKQESVDVKAVCRLSHDKIKAAAESGGQRLVLRTRRQGDYIVPLGMKGRKKLQDFFVDEKCPAERRSRIPLLCLGSEVIWAAWPAGGRISENFKVEDSTERIISLEYSTKL